MFSYVDGISIVAIVILIVAITFVVKAIAVVPQQNAWVVERLGKFHATLQPGLNIVMPFIDRVAYKHSLKEVPLDTPSQVCITKDNTQLQVDGVLYFQVTDPQRASYGASNYILAITQLSQTTLRSVIGKLELDRTFEEREFINHSVVSAIDEAAMNWGVKVLRYEIKDITPPNAILHAMQQQITAEREKRALIASSEGRKQEQINIATGEREAQIARSEGEKMAQINIAQGQAGAVIAVAEATARAIQMVAETIRQPGGIEAVNLRVADRYVDAFGNLAKAGNTLIVPANLADISSLIASALTVVKSQGGAAKSDGAAPKARAAARIAARRGPGSLLQGRSVGVDAGGLDHRASSARSPTSSARTVRPACSGRAQRPLTPRSAMRLRKSGSFIACWMAAASLSTTAFGVPFGA